MIGGCLVWHNISLGILKFSSKTYEQIKNILLMFQLNNGSSLLVNLWNITVQLVHHLSLSLICSAGSIWKGPILARHWFDCLVHQQFEFRIFWSENLEEIFSSIAYEQLLLFECHLNQCNQSQESEMAPALPISITLKVLTLCLGSTIFYAWVKDWSMQTP